MTGPLLRPRSARTGVSLLEVLISIFIVLIGLLGVAAVIPAGRVELIEAAKADRSAACGLSALNTVCAAAYFDPRQLGVISGGGFTPVVNAVPSLDNPSALFTDSYVVDPLFYARQAAITAAMGQVAMAANAETNNVTGSPAQITAMARRVSPAVFGLLSAAPQRAAAERMFTAEDDLVIPVPKDRNDRPRQLLLDPAGVSFPFPNRSTDSGAPSGVAQIRQSQGDYTWMSTVTPLGAQPDVYVAASQYFGQSVGGVGQYLVSAAVFYKRNFNVDPAQGDVSEPYGRVQFYGGGLGGGDVQLSVDASNPISWLNVKEKEWILLGGFTRAIKPSPRPPRFVLKWYRIVALSDVDQASHTRWATLAGPDWELTDANNAYDKGYAILYRGVIGVYTSTMKIVR